MEPVSEQRAVADFFANFLGDTTLREAIQDGRRFIYKPQPDITTYELSLCVYLIAEKLSANSSLWSEQKTYDLLPPKAQRHFVIVEMDFND